MLKRNQRDSREASTTQIYRQDGDPGDRALLQVHNQCDARFLKTLDLSGFLIVGYINFWSSLKQFPSLQVLDLHNNSMTEAHLCYLVECPNLSTINLDQNRIRELSLSRIYANLKTISCCNNQLLKVSFVASNPSVKQVRLAHNRLSVINSEQLPNLEVLDVSDNELVVVNINPKIKELQLVRCKLKSLVFLNKLTGLLRSLKVSENCITEIRHTNIIGLSQLEYADFSHNAIRSVEGLQHCKHSLRTLDLSCNRITDWEKLRLQLCQLGKLEILSTNDNDFCRNISSSTTVRDSLIHKLPSLVSLNATNIPKQLHNKSTQKIATNNENTRVAYGRKMEKPSLNTNKSRSRTPEKEAEEMMLFKQSPFKLYTDVLQESKQQQGTVQKDYARPALQYTLGNAEQPELTFNEEESIDYRRTVPLNSYLPVLMPQQLQQLLPLYMFPPQPISRAEAQRQLIFNVLPDSKEFILFQQLFLADNPRRIDMLKKSMQWNKFRALTPAASSEDLWDMQGQELPIKLCFLCGNKIADRDFRDLGNGKIQLQELVAQSRSENWMITTNSKLLQSEYIIVVVIPTQKQTDNRALYRGTRLEKSLAQNMLLAYIMEANLKK